MPPPPPQWTGGGGPATEVLSSDGGDRGGNRTPLIIVLVIIVVVGLLGGGTYLLFFRDGGEEDSSANASSTSEAEDTEEAPDDTEPTPEEPSEAEPPDEEGEQPPDEGEQPPEDAPAPNPDPTVGPLLAYESLGNSWEPTQVNLFPMPTAERVLTEPDYIEGSDWQALIAAGKARPEWVVPGDPKQTATRAAEWFATDGFGPAEVTPETTGEEPLTIDGYDAYVLEQHFAFSIPELEAKGETVYILAVDFGETAGLFIASIPDTHPDLVADADRARDSLAVVE